MDRLLFALTFICITIMLTKGSTDIVENVGSLKSTEGYASNVTIALKNDSSEQVTEGETQATPHDHQHEGSIMVDFHTVIESVKKMIAESEKRIISSLKSDGSSSSSTESYRTADRKAVKDEKKVEHDDEDED